MLRIDYIGHKTTIPGWPEAGTIEGLFDAMSRWPLDTRLDYSGAPAFEPHPDRKPFRGPALRFGAKVYSDLTNGYRYLDGAPVDEEHPDAVSFMGNFVGYSFGFNLMTDDRELIARLDAAIAANLARHGYVPRTHPLADKPAAASWILIEKETSRAVAETFDYANVERLNTEKYEAVATAQYLAQYNCAVREAGGSEPAPGWRRRLQAAAVAPAEAAEAGSGDAKAAYRVTAYQRLGSKTEALLGTQLRVDVAKPIGWVREHADEIARKGVNVERFGEPVALHVESLPQDEEGGGQTAADRGSRERG